MSSCHRRVPHSLQGCEAQLDPVCPLDPYFDLVVLILTALGPDQLPTVCPALFPPQHLQWVRPLCSAWRVTRGRSLLIAPGHPVLSLCFKPLATLESGHSGYYQSLSWCCIWLCSLTFLYTVWEGAFFLK